MQNMDQQKMNNNGGGNRSNFNANKNKETTISSESQSFGGEHGMGKAGLLQATTSETTTAANNHEFLSLENLETVAESRDKSFSPTESHLVSSSKLLSQQKGEQNFQQLHNNNETSDGKSNKIKIIGRETNFTSKSCCLYCKVQNFSDTDHR